MTTYPERQSRMASWPLFAALAVGLPALLTAVGTFWDLTGNDARHDSLGDDLREYAITLGIIVVAVAVVFGLVVRTATPTNAGGRAVVLAVLGLLSLVAFWTGLPMVLAAGAGACVAIEREGTGRFGRASLVSVALTSVTFVLAVVAAIAG